MIIRGLVHNLPMVHSIRNIHPATLIKNGLRKLLCHSNVTNIDNIKEKLVSELKF